MKTFEDGYFVPARFLKGVETFSKNAEKTDKAPLHVAYNVNDGYFQIMGASLVSVLENNAHRAVMFHIFTDGYSKENAQKMEQLADRYGCVIKLYTLHMEPFADFHVKVERFSRITYGRIVMPLILAAETDHFLYLDADTMVIRPLDELYHWDLTGKAMGAVSERMPDAKRRGDYLHLNNGRYFNDGVMMVNIPEWQKQNITEKAFSLQKEPKNVFWVKARISSTLSLMGQMLFCRLFTMNLAVVKMTPSKKGQSFIGQGGANHGRWSCPIMMLSGGPIMRPLRGRP